MQVEHAACTPAARQNLGHISFPRARTRARRDHRARICSLAPVSQARDGGDCDQCQIFESTVKPSFLCFLLLLLPLVAQAQSWTDHVIAGMYGPPSNAADFKFGGAAPFGLHEARPATQPDLWRWSYGARTGRWNNTRVGEATAVNGIIGHVSGSLDYMVEVRNMEVWMRINGEWRQVFTSAGRDAEAIYGSYYLMKDFSHAGGMTEAPGPAGGSSFALRDGYWSHFYCQGSPPGRVSIPEGFQRLHVRYEVRLIGPAASTAVVVGRAGADYFRSFDSAAPAKDIQPGVFTARHRKLGPDWRWLTATSMSADEIRADPPPSPDNWAPLRPDSSLAEGDPAQLAPDSSAERTSNVTKCSRAGAACRQAGEY